MDKIEKTSELALIRALPDAIIPNVQRGRLKNLCFKLQESVDGELGKLPLLEDSDYDLVKERMLKFGKVTGWEGKQKHIVTLISFLLDMLDDSKFKYDPKITELMNDMFYYFDRKETTKPLCFIAGTIAGDKWRSLEV